MYPAVAIGTLNIKKAFFVKVVVLYYGNGDLIYTHLLLKTHIGTYIIFEIKERERVNLSETARCAGGGENIFIDELKKNCIRNPWATIFCGKPLGISSTVVAGIKRTR